MIHLGGSSCTIFLIEFGIPMKRVRLIKMSINKIYVGVRVGKHLSDTFSIMNG